MFRRILKHEYFLKLNRKWKSLVYNEFLGSRTLASKIGYKPKYLILQYAGYVDIKKHNFQLLQILLS